MTQNDNEHVLTVSDLMRRWKCGQKAVLEAIHRGDLPAFKVGKRAYRVTLKEIERYESAHAKRGAA